MTEQRRRAKIAEVPVGSELVERSQDVLGCTPVLRGTRVPVQTLIEYLEAGERLDDFLEEFPSVRREQAVGLVQLVKQIALR